MREKPVLPSYLRSDDWDKPEEPSPLRHPVRLLTAAGAAIVVVGVLMPWMDYGIDTFHASANGVTGDTWGVFAMVAAGGQVAVLASRSAARSRSRLIQLLPAILGLAGLVLHYDARLGAQALADSYRASGYDVTFTVGLDILLVGTLLCAVGGVASGVMAWRAMPPSPRPSLDAAARRASGAGVGFSELALGAVAGVACAFAGGVLAVNLTHGAGTASALIAVLSLSGGLAGVVLTDELWRRFGSRR